MALANIKVKTLTQKPKKKNQRPNSKHSQVQPKAKASAALAVEPEEVPEQLNRYDSYYKQLAEEVETIERHVRELRQTPGLEDLTEAEAHAKVDLMLRFSAWVFNQHLEDQHIVIIADEDEIKPESATVSKVQKPVGKSNKKVTKSLSR